MKSQAQKNHAEHTWGFKEANEGRTRTQKAGFKGNKDGRKGLGSRMGYGERGYGRTRKQAKAKGFRSGKHGLGRSGEGYAEANEGRTRKQKGHFKGNLSGRSFPKVVSED